MAKTAEPVKIKKYANRRLYNTGTSTYVTLEDLATMVKGGEDFVVEDAKTGEDVTRSVLAQIIFEQENKEGQNLLPVTFLRQLIRFYGDSMQGFMGAYLEKNIQIFMDLQHKMTEQSGGGVNPEAWQQFMNMQSPMMQGMMGTYLEQSRSAFAQMQEQMQKNSEQMLAALGLKR